jgi:BirA family biotin operon repressor/biotin-[acetyl-CoA-carboxylase] ligase
VGRDLFELTPGTSWLGRQLEVYAEIDSTNLRADALAARGAPEGTLVVADRQSAGRGRLGRSFFSPGGVGLYFSLILRPEIPPDRTHAYVFVASLAVAREVAAHVPGDVEIKWPNDVRIDRLKTSGINLSARLEGNRVASLVLGIGVNVNTAREDFPPELRTLATSLRVAAGRELDRVAFAEALLRRLETGVDEFRMTGLSPLLDQWTKFFRMAGNRVRIGGPGIAQELEGVVEGVDATGALVLQTERGSERVLAGDVTVLRGEA